jgi:hypothetical protein
MSDYLWDKTGEPEPEVERLEELLGGLRFQPRTFEVPATLPFAPRRARTAPSHFSWSRMAIAASLLVTLVLGAWLVVSERRTANAPQLVVNLPAAEEKTTPPQQKPTDQELAGETPNNESAATARGEKHDDGARSVAPIIHPRLRAATLVATQKRFVERPRQSNERDVNAPREEIAMTPREKEAMEKFVLAMKVTSEKLGYAERQVAGLGHDSPQR